MHRHVCRRARRCLHSRVCAVMCTGMYIDVRARGYVLVFRHVCAQALRMCVQACDCCRPGIVMAMPDCCDGLIIGIVVDLAETDVQRQLCYNNT